MDPSASALIRPFQSFERLTVRQRKNWTEILLSFEMRNRYEVFDQSRMPVLRAQEVGSGALELLARLFLGPMRPFRMEIVELPSEQVLLRLRRPFRFWLSVLEVSGPGGQPFGTIRQRWSWFRRIYEIEDHVTGERMEVFGPFFRPWTFELRRHGQTMGAIRKRWSGLGKELFTDADNFGVELEMVPAPSLKALAFAATVLIDVVHFERSKN
ncbi:MAG: phospholipid scramblase-related protein [Myxococcota bacterium]